MPDPIATLRDVHLPPPVSMWPLAWGWYLLAGFIILCMLVSFYFLWKYLRRTAPRRYALKQLHQLRNQANSMAQLSILVKRVALAYYPTHQVAGLQGEAWLEFLNATGDTQEFTGPVGRLLIVAPYKKQETKGLEPLFDLLEDWFKKQGLDAIPKGISMEGGAQ